MKRYLLNMLLLTTSVIFSLVIAEGVLRLVLDPVDYLMPYLVSDEILGHKVEPYSAGHDAWGFRNKSVPVKSHFVAIGDSQTYGIAASPTTNATARLANGITLPANSQLKHGLDSKGS